MPQLGHTNGQLKPCPDTPNCVSSQTDPSDSQHYLEALSFDAEAANIIPALVAIINEMPRSQIISQETNYVHATFSSRVFRFVDDVEFYVDADSKTLHHRSAARVGHSDFNVNRKRLKTILDQLKARL